MLISKQHEDLTVDKRYEVAEIANALGIKAVFCSMGAFDGNPAYEGWDGQHAMLCDGVGEGILYSTPHGAQFAALRLLKELIP
jgi:hypothetical protein